MNTTKIQEEEIRMQSDKLQKASSYLTRSFEVTRALDAENLSGEDLEMIDAMTMRFVRTYNTFAHGLLPTLYQTTRPNITATDDTLFAFAAEEGIVESANLWRTMGISLAEVSKDLSTLGEADIIQQFIGFTPVLLEASKRAIDFAR